MLSKIKEYEVTNISTSTVARGGYIILPDTTVKVNVSEYKINEFKASVNLQVKELDSASDGRLKCPYCNKDYKTKAGLDKHIEDKHTEEEGSEE